MNLELVRSTGCVSMSCERKCPFFKAGVLDTYGDHAIACHGRGDENARHNWVRDEINSVCLLICYSLTTRGKKKTHSRKLIKSRRRLYPDM